ncbi:MAG TPA: hypothetical protein VL484_09300 [Vicinamibacterales bacterium]|jgi:hypothetical protein|nr:hypothetical protein [Vicinamibacterales bacterium]
MKPRNVPRFALLLLQRLVPGSEPLAGDLLEEFARRPSRIWFWTQVLAGIAHARFVRDVEIRPLRLVGLQPADAIERSRRLRLRFPPVNLSASPVDGVGGLGLVILGALVTVVMPQGWWLLLGSALGGTAAGVLAIAIRRPAR